MTMLGSIPFQCQPPVSTFNLTTSQLASSLPPPSYCKLHTLDYSPSNMEWRTCDAIELDAELENTIQLLNLCMGFIWKEVY